VLIVEGPDNSGKTTLITQLIEADPTLRLLKRDKFVRDRGENIATSYIKCLLPTDGDFLGQARGIADRLMASECIYGDLFRGGCRMSEAEHITILDILKAYNAMIVFCDPPDWAIRSTWIERSQMYPMYTDGKVIVAAYRRRIVKIFQPLPVFRYDWTEKKSIRDAAWQRMEILRINHARTPKEMRHADALPR
jgi:hypothetical protein